MDLIGRLGGGMGPDIPKHYFWNHDVHTRHLNLDVATINALCMANTLAVCCTHLERAMHLLSVEHSRGVVWTNFIPNHYHVVQRVNTMLSDKNNNDYVGDHALKMMRTDTLTAYRRNIPPWAQRYLFERIAEATRAIENTQTYPLQEWMSREVGLGKRLLQKLGWIKSKPKGPSYEPLLGSESALFTTSDGAEGYTHKGKVCVAAGVVRYKHKLDGEIVGYKLAHHPDIPNEFCVVVLVVPVGAQTNYKHTSDSKFRTDRAVVAAILPLSIARATVVDAPLDHALALHATNYVYRLGVEQKPTNGFDPHGNIVCGAGLHFFVTLKSLEAYVRETVARGGAFPFEHRRLRGARIIEKHTQAFFNRRHKTKQD